MTEHKRKVFIIAGNLQYTNMFKQMGWEVVDNMDEADLVQFTGGEDVSAYLYGEKDHPQAYTNYRRDAAEEQLFKRCLVLNKPMAGICRGGQFLNVMCGGGMFQHVDKHGIRGTHEAVDVATGRILQVTSTHHQMMRAGPDSVLLTYAGLSTFREHMHKTAVVNKPRSEGDQDVEALFYPSRLTLCFQPHPEHGYEECREYYFELIARCLGL